jgi:hypothetical protein
MRRKIANLEYAELTQSLRVQRPAERVFPSTRKRAKLVLGLV